MKHSIIIKKIHTLCLNDFKNYLVDNDWNYEIKLDATEEITHDNPFIAVSYMPLTTTQRYLSTGSFNHQGYVSFEIYEKNPTRYMIILDLIINYFKDSEIDGLRYTERLSSDRPGRENAGDLFYGFIDFKACLI